MTPNGLRARLLAREPLCGTFVKTPAIEMMEILALSGLDFVCLDAEHSAFDRARMDASLAMARALGLPALVRVPDGTPVEILKALDAGATGVVVPHCYSVAKAETIARAAHFGHGGRGFAGSTRWAGFATRSMSDVLAGDSDTVVLGQIEEPEGVEAAEAIAAVPNLDGLFVGPADLAVCYGKTDITDPMVRSAMERVGKAAAAHGKAAVTFAPSVDQTRALMDLGITMLFFASEHAWILQGAKATAGVFRKAVGATP
ncbi:MAG: aldolase/citrate lyase family protein [Pseudomonadota bacterium]